MAEQGLILDREYWPDKAKDEALKGREYITSHPELQGDSTDTVLCLDISQSMEEGKAFHNMIKTARTFIYGIMNVAQTRNHEENISIVTFGHETKIVSYLSKDYPKLLEALDVLQLAGHGGPSPLEGGLLLSMSSLLAKPMHNLQGYHIRPRIILMTDGLVTPGVIITGEDNQYLELKDRISMEMNATSQVINKANYTIYCVPFGVSEQTYLNILTENTSGKIIPADEIQRLVNMTSNCILATNLKKYHCIPGEDWKSIMRQHLGETLSEKDYDYVVYMAEIAASTLAADGGPTYKECDKSMLPPIGTRVRRGPDWEFTDQDKNGVGTIIGHTDKKWMWVQWDHGGINNYPYNNERGYSIVVVDEPRQLSPHKAIDVGISVVRGPSWSSGNDDGGPGNTGICFRIESNMVSVRWENGVIGQYRFGKEGCYDIEVSALGLYSNLPDFSLENRPFKSEPEEESDFDADATPVGYEVENVFSGSESGDMVQQHQDMSNEQYDLEETEIKTVGQTEESVVKTVDSENYTDDTSGKNQNEESCTNKNSKTFIWKYFQSGTWKLFDSAISDTLEEEYLLKRKTKAINMDNVSFRVIFSKSPMEIRNLKTSEVCTVEREESNIPQEVLIMEKEWIDLYKQSLLKGKEKVYNIRVMVVGPEGVGKTVLTRRLLKQHVDINRRQSTNGIDVHIEKCGTRVSDGTWEFDKDKLEEAKRVENRFANVMHHNPSQKDDVLDETENVMSTSTLSEGLREMLASNKSTEQMKSSDLYDIQDATCNEPGSWNNYDTNPLTVEGIIAAHVMPSTDITTPKNLEAENKEEMFKLIKERYDQSDGSEKEVIAEISFWDFGGQIVFYSTHQTFLTPRAVYIVVIDISKALKRKVKRPCYTDNRGETQWNYEDYLLFWLKSIKTYGSADKGTVIPPIIVVATHLDKLREEIKKTTDADQVQAELEFQVENFERELKEELRRHGVRPLVKDFVAIDNNTIDNETLEKLRMEIYSVSSKQKHWGEEKPASWIFLEKKILDQKKKNMKIISFEGIQKLNAYTECPIGSDNELQMFLTFHHAIGNVIYFNEEGLNQSIILNPQWLIDAFKLIITSEEYFNDQDTLTKWQILDDSGILHPSLIDVLWKQDQGNNLFHEHKAHLIRIMEKLDIIAKPKLFDDEIDESFNNYLVPSMLKDVLTDEELQIITSGSFATPYFCYEFDFLPSAVFHRLLAVCMGKWPVAKRKNKFLLFCGCGIFDLSKNRNHLLLIGSVGKLIQMKIYRYDTIEQLPERKICEDVRNFVEKSLTTILSRSEQCIKSTQYIRCIMASFQTTEGLLKVEELMKSSYLICHEHNTLPSHSVISYNVLQCWYKDKESDKCSKSNTENYSVHENYRFEQYYRTPTEIELSRLAKRIGSNFKNLGRALGVPDREIETIKANHRDNVLDQCYEVLKKWTEMYGKQATLVCLKEKLREEGIHVNIVTEIIDSV